MSRVTQLAMLLLIPAVGYQTPRLITAPSPSSPWNSIIGNVVVATAHVDVKGSVTQVHVVEGVTPFTEEAVRSIQQWQFEQAMLDGNAVASEVSVVMMFRPHSFGNYGVGGPSLGFTKPNIARGDHPALPTNVFDPEWPIARALTPGAVIFDLELSEDGLIHRMRLINDVPATAEWARQTVRQWSFAPAVRDGKAVRSTMIVAISFVTPVTS